MKHLRVFFKDGSSYDTSANSSAQDFFKYLTQADPFIVYENPETGAETTKIIDRVEEVRIAE